MSDVEVNSTNSFVDIIANTTGMIIKLTLLAMLLGHQQSRQVDKDHQRLQHATELSQAMRQEYAGLPDATAAAERSLSDLRQRVAAGEDNLRQVESDLAAVKSQTRSLIDDLAALQPIRAAGSAALTARAQTATQEVARIQAALDAIQRTAMADTDASLAARRAQAEAQAAAITDELKRLRASVAAAEVPLAAAEAEAAAVHKTLAETQAALIHQIEVHRPITNRPYGSRPVLAECYQDAQGVARVRLLTDANYRRDGPRWLPLRDGAVAATLGQGDDFTPVMASQADDRRYLYLMVRTDAFAGFRAARAIVEARGWWVEWDPLEVGQVLTMGARQGPAGQP